MKDRSQRHLVFFHSEACNQSLWGGREKKSGHLIEVEKGKRRNSFVKQLRHASIFKSFHDKYSTEEINNWNTGKKNIKVIWNYSYREKHR